MLRFAILIISIVLVLLGLLNAYKLATSLKWLQKLLQQPRNNSVDFVLLFPVLEEQTKIADAITFLAKVEYPLKHLRIVFVTTAKEGVKSGKSTTAEVVTRLIENHKHIEHLHYPHKKGVKADQLNWAIRELEKQGIVDDDTILGVYDIDSAILPGTLERVAGITKDQNINVVQQPSLYFKNWLELPLLARSFAIYQTVYGCFYEISSWRQWNTPLQPMRYCTGHGMFVRASFLRRVGYFPSPLEDTRFGHICAFLNEQIAVVPVFDDCETTISTRNRVKQASVWFSGDVQYIDGLRAARALGPINKKLAAWLLVNKTYRTLVWAFQGIIIVGLIIAAFYLGSALLLLSVLFYTWLPAVALRRHMSLVRKLAYNDTLPVPSLAAIGVLPLTAFFKSLGPWYATWRYARAHLLNQEFLYPKTDRL